MATLEGGAEESGSVEGRAQELARLEGLIEASGEGGQGRLLLVVGEAGIGKTALIRGLKARQVGAGATVIHGGAGSSEGLSGFSALQPLLRHALGIEEGTASEVAEAQLGIRFESRPERRELAALLNGPFSLRLPESSTTRALRGRERAEAASRLLTDVCSDALSAGMLVILEDLQWFDSASTRLLNALIRGIPGVTWLATSRTMARDERAGVTEEANADETLQLGPLSEDGVRALLEGLLGRYPVADEMVREIHEKSGGHPFLARQTLFALERRHAIVCEEERWRIAASTELDTELFADVQGLISSRLDDLGPVARLALKVASVIGTEFDRGLVERAMPRSQEGATLEREIGELLSARLIDAQGEDRYAFEHALVRDVTYDLLLFEQRRGLHRSVARELEAGAWNAKSAVIHLHYDAAGDLEDSVRWADVAADEAIDSGAWLESIRLLRRCLEHGASSSERDPSIEHVRWLRKLSESYGHLGQTGERRASAHRALELAEGGRLTRKRPLTRLPRWSRILLRGAREFVPLASSAGELSTKSTPAQLSRAHAQAALVAYFDNDILSMIRQTLHAIELAERAGLRGDLARHYASLGGILGVAGAHTLGAKHLSRAIEIAEAADDAPSLVFVHMVRALYSVGRGDWEAMERSSATGQGLADALQLHSEWGNIQIVRFWSRVYRGAWEQAEEDARQLLARSRESGHEQHESWGHRGMGIVHLERGANGQAKDCLERSLRVPVRDGATGEQIESLGSLALALHRLGSHTEAVDALRRAAELGEATGRPTSHAQSVALGNAALASLGAWAGNPAVDDLRALHSRVMGALRRAARAFPVAQPILLLRRAQTDEVAGRRSRARRLGKAARRSADRMGLSLAGIDEDLGNGPMASPNGPGSS
jgi:tetratricopeptide (TPR) repeat protein